ncbi:aminopeptidase P family protein [Dehalococcoidia bacterium]|nr:aminopeptidase P family protein [Dehalococcoidia bacterium]
MAGIHRGAEDTGYSGLPPGRRPRGKGALKMIPRLEEVRRRLGEMDVILISQATNRRYLSGFTGSAGFLFISRKDAVLAVDFRYVEQARAQSPDFEVVKIKGEFPEWFPGLISELGARHVGFESGHLTLTAYRQLVRAARKLPPKARPRLHPTRGLVEALRCVKEEKETRLIEEAASLADSAIEHANAILQPGITERELAWELERFLREKGSERLPFEIIVASGPNAALPHAPAGDRAILRGEPVIIDLGARVNGYCSDITRTICFGEPNDTLAQIHSIVQEAQLAALKKLRAGMGGEEVHQLAKDVIEQAGYGEAFGHGLGHGIGLDSHEKPRLGPNSTDVLAEDMVFTLEPGIYLDGWGGVRIEDMVLLDKSGPRLLTRAGKLKL